MIERNTKSKELICKNKEKEKMAVFVKDGFAVRIPAKTARYQANCHKEWGTFIKGDTKGLTASKAEKAGLTKGSWVEMALIYLDEKVLTFEPHYIDEPFAEIWGIPTAGEMKDQFHAQASELVTFLLHRQSKDKLSAVFDEFSKLSFNQWVEEGMIGDHNEYAIAKINEYYFTNIFRFEMIQTEGKNGYYFYVKTTYRPAESDNEKKACTIAKEIYEAQTNGINYCQDERIESNYEGYLLKSNDTKALTAGEDEVKTKTKK